MKEVFKRIIYEGSTKVPYSESGILFWPEKEKKCYSRFLRDFD